MKATKEQIARLDRLKKRSDFLRVQNTGKRWVAKGLVLQAAVSPLPENDIPENEESKEEGGAAGPIRFGLTASRKLSVRAVDRNRVRRRLRAAACDILPLYARPGADYVLIGRKETADRSYDELCRDLRWCLRRLEFSRETADKGAAGENYEN